MESWWNPVYDVYYQYWLLLNWSKLLLSEGSNAVSSEKPCWGKFMWVSHKHNLNYFIWSNLLVFSCKGFHSGTLIDGEMIIDKIPDAGLKRRYLAYDLVALNHHSVIKVGSHSVYYMCLIEFLIELISGLLTHNTPIVLSCLAIFCCWSIRIIVMMVYISRVVSMIPILCIMWVTGSS